MSAKPDSHRPGHREATPVTRKEGTFFLPSGPAKLTFFNQLRLADFAECMRSLGYPRVISMENFRSPNFELVADCLEFLVTRYDETAVVDGDISTEKDRVHFLKNVNRAFSQKVTSISQSTHSASLFTARYGVRNIYCRTQSTGNCYADPLRRTPFQSRNTRHDRLTLSAFIVSGFVAGFSVRAGWPVGDGLHSHESVFENLARTGDGARTRNERE